MLHIFPEERWEPLPPKNFPRNGQIFDSKYGAICDRLMDFTRARDLLKGKYLHAYVIKSGLQTMPYLCQLLMNFYSKLYLPYCSEKIFHESGVDRFPTAWASIISGFTKNELPLCGIEHFKLMLRHDVNFLDDHVFPCLTKACVMIKDHALGQSVHCLAVKTLFNVNVFVGSSLIDMYAKFGRLADAQKVFDEMPERNVVSWSVMMYVCIEMGDWEGALRFFKDALWHGLDVNGFTFSSVIGLCGNLTLFQLGKQMQALCFKMNHYRTGFIGSALISMYSRCGEIEGARGVFDEVLDKNVGMWNAMMIAYAHHSQTRRVFELFEEMENVGVKPNGVTFSCILYACSHAGLVEEGNLYFRKMNVYGLEPRSKHYSSMVDLLSRAGKLQEAIKVIEEMPMQTESAWGALLTGCRIQGDTELGGYVADKVFESGQVSIDLHFQASNAYAAAGRYEEAAKVRMMLRDGGHRKETGLSWVEDGNRVHTFAAGERRHELSAEIYRKLEEMEEETARAGYVLKEAGVEEKIQRTRYHSERLAIAFALISFPQSRPIRVMKNMRCCSDCHVAIKFMSKCSERTITVRDNSRFHRFQNGECSCGDYW
ncbi:mitochondrial RNAediting factor 1 [Perilla frutescens var. hirtella]|nr:mitochondrial RNAediting factor 1 [Perilla frutescens var. hirtella]